jgi:SAM-dependent methyltransferase
VDLRERTANDRRHPWELARARFFRRLIGQHVALAGVTRVLDVGAGDGWFAHELSADLPATAQIVCWDANYRSEDLATPPGEQVTRTAQVPGGLFDLVLVLDVLEHVLDDEAFLGDAVLPRLAPSALVVVSVPAHPRLYSDHDRMLEHHRRYRPSELYELLGRHLDVVARGSLFTTLLAPRVAVVLLERAGWHRATDGVGDWSAGPALTSAVTAVLDADAALGRRLADRGVRLPGLSTWAVCRR